TASEFGEAEMLKFGCGTEFTVSTKVVACVGLPPASVPVIVTVYVPAGVEVDVARVRVELPEPPPIAPGLKLALAPAGRPLADRFTVSLKPFVGLTVTVVAVLFPAVTVDEPGASEMVKSGCDAEKLGQSALLPIQKPPKSTSSSRRKLESV